MIPQPWTIEQIDALRTMWAAGKTCEQIGMTRPRSNADIDNRLKGIFDLLQQTGAIADDKLIMGVNAYWSGCLPTGVAAEISIVEADKRGAAA